MHFRFFVLLVAIFGSLMVSAELADEVKGSNRTSKQFGAWPIPYVHHTAPNRNPYQRYWSQYRSSPAHYDNALVGDFVEELYKHQDQRTRNGGDFGQAMRRQRPQERPGPTAWVTSDGKPCIPGFLQPFYSLLGITTTTTTTTTTTQAPSSSSTTCAPTPTCPAPLTQFAVKACDKAFVDPAELGTYPITSATLVDATKCAPNNAVLPGNKGTDVCLINVKPASLGSHVLSTQSGTITGGDGAKQCLLYLTVSPPFNQIQVTCKNERAANLDVVGGSVTIRGGTATNPAGVTAATPLTDTTSCGDATKFCTPKNKNVDGTPNVYSSVKSPTSFLMFYFDSTKFNANHECSWTAVIA